ncbi:MAG: carotenoid 1,2-hydratase [Acidobacteria bacterium]|nr:carotenoid 1,2-hydratase [Acidobacteriota bacterium]
MKHPIFTTLLLTTLALTLTPAQPDPWRRALPPFRFDFARDHASHPDYKIEWWYYTGNLRTANGRRFGYQLTFFRVGIDFNPINPSRWAVRDLYTAHFALSDLNGNNFRHAERINRAGVGWAGADQEFYRVWNEDWEARLSGQGQHLLRADGETMKIDLLLDPGKPPVIQGENGVSQKGNAPGNASHYYSLTRMPTRGTIVVDQQPYEVSGESWMDHEFGTSFLEAGQIGWDWLSIQLDDGRDLMLYQFRRQDGTTDPHSNGMIVGRYGETARLTATEFSLTPLEFWESPASGARYPIAWSITIPSQSVSLTARAAINDQELQTSESTRVTYWEGAITLDGSHRGLGYLEMTGYAGAAMGAFKN